VSLIPDLEVQLRDAAAHRRERARRRGLGSAAMAIVAAAGTPPRDARSTVVATGTAPVAGPWQLEVWRNHGGPSPPGERRGRCLFIQLLDPPGGDPTGLTGFCGGLGFRKTPASAARRRMSRRSGGDLTERSS
jgi:hypothetical protein